MPVRLTLARRRGMEILDDSATPNDVRQRSMADLRRANMLFGGTRSAVRAFRDVLPGLPTRAVMLDVGTGTADIPASVRRVAGRAGVGLTAIGYDVSESLLRSARAGRAALDAAVVGDARRLPFAPSSADLVTCSQLLHHFPEDDARAVIAELHRVSRHAVIISDLRRSWLAAAGFWIVSVALRFHPVTRHDGVASVFRGFTRRELESLVMEATGIRPRIRSGIFWRLSATWNAGR
jgi:ubiquinone/menaquinone biosynthesis C-methylase UbiE